MYHFLCRTTHCLLLSALLILLPVVISPLAVYQQATETTTATATATASATLSQTPQGSETITLTATQGTQTQTLTPSLTTSVTTSPTATITSSLGASPTATLVSTPSPTPVVLTPTLPQMAETATWIPFPEVTFIFPQATATDYLLAAARHPQDPALQKPTNESVWRRIGRLLPVFFLFVFWGILAVWFIFIQVRTKDQ